MTPIFIQAVDVTRPHTLLTPDSEFSGSLTYRYDDDGQSQIPLKHPVDLKYGKARLYPALHAIIPVRFQRAFTNASVLKTDGNILE